MSEIEKVLEAALFANVEPLTLKQMANLFIDEKVDTITMQNSLTALQKKYTDSALELKQVATGWRFQVRADYAPNIAKLWEKKPPKYSRAVMETLALIAYRQPITRSEIEDVRGVAVSTQIIRALMDRNWVKIVGRRDVPGKPALFGTTKVFLDYFNLRKLSDLPELPASADLEQQGEKLKQQLNLLGLPDAEVQSSDSIESQAPVVEQNRLDAEEDNSEEDNSEDAGTLGANAAENASIESHADSIAQESEVEEDNSEDADILDADAAENAAIESHVDSIAQESDAEVVSDQAGD